MELLVLVFIAPIFIVLFILFFLSSFFLGFIAQVLPLFFVLILFSVLGSLMLLPFLNKLEIYQNQLHTLQNKLNEHKYDKYGFYFAIFAFTLTLIYHFVYAW
ncbi:TPA: hypothetical protein ACPDKD_002136 [Pasteurella multocida]|uniref:hypothetical protein n=1 Tax=Pasteurella multocida TaxID=747 RepID=UPI0039780F37